MKKIKTICCFLYGGASRQKLRSLSLTLILFLTMGVHQSYAQNILETKVSIKVENATLVQVIKELQKKVDFQFLFNKNEVKDVVNINLNLENVTIETVLKAALKGYELGFEVVDGAIVITPVPKTTSSPKKLTNENLVSITGLVKDEEGNPLPGANIMEVGTYRGVAADVNGNFKFAVKNENSQIKFSFMGFDPQIFTVGQNRVFNVTLKEASTNLDEVVVTGIIERRSESFTGTATTFKAEELKSVGTQNLVKSLSTLDPSLNIMENNDLGSNPNALPEIRLRGEAVFDTPGVEGLGRANLSGDPNLPIFILDDFQTTLEKVFDLDMNRVESVTILKDASATAIYGSRAANGVIVIKTIQPKSGELKLSYNFNLDFNFPDLRSYNLLNAEELFQLQKELNILNFVHAQRYVAEEVERLVQKGVNTDWIKQPVRNVVGQKHSLNLMGGDKRMRYMLDLNYQNRPGVMKASSRENLGIAVTLAYNANDKLIFRNKLSVDKSKSEESPYGDFNAYTSMQPYFPIHDEQGNLIEKYRYYNDYDEGYRSLPYYNPIFEASVGNTDETKYTDINNNFAIEWKLYPSLLFKANVSYTHNSSENEWFRSPQSYVYWGNQYDIDEKGEYSFTRKTTERYYGNASFNFMKDFNKHFINVSLAFNISEDTYRSLGFQAQGFAAKKYADPAYSSGYGDGNLPVSLEGRNRLIGVLGLIGYTYKDRYFADFTYRMDGSSQYGDKDKSAGFFSGGLGWNIHKEKFLEESKIFNKLRIRGTYGETGSINFSSYQAKNIVQYYTSQRYLGLLGSHLVGLGNENLKWQTTKTTDLGLEFELFNSKISGSFTYYVKKTTEMVIPLSTPPSTGFDSFMENLGEMENKGFEFALRAQLLNEKDIKWSVFVNGSQNKSQILAIGNSLEAYNQYSDRSGLTADEVAQDDNLGSGRQQKEASHRFLVRYQEGQSNTAIWAVRSLGIDPMTGQELFLDKNGKPTFIWNASDKVVVGDAEPDLRGTFGTNISYKDFEVGLIFSYEFGGQVYNYTLVDKIENSDKSYNVDRRALEETWRQPGDVVKYKTNYNISLGSRNQTTPASSRFVQTQNLLHLSSININYNVPASFYKHLGMESMRLTLNMNDLFYWSTVQRERGFSYPYARSFTLSLRANF